jgi:hypothetical protein
MSAATVVSGPSGGEPGSGAWPGVSRDMLDRHPGIVRQVMTIGMRPRAGHDRARWESVRWEDYRARVGVQQRRGPWVVRMSESAAEGPDAWISQALGLPHEPGWYTTLWHDDRGLVMSDLPAEIAGALPFLDRLATTPRRLRVLISGLGLGIIPAHLLAARRTERIDIVEIDPDIIALITGDEAAREVWAADRRLHVHQGDACTWTPPGFGCALHPDCPAAGRWDAAWHDIWDLVSAGNLPSMHRLHRHYARWTGWQMSWERPECEAMRRRGQTLPHPGLGCLGVLEDGYA